MTGYGEALELSRIIQLVIEGWGAFFCIVAIIVIGQTRWADTKKADGLIRFIIADGILLVSDVFAIGFRGHFGTGAFYIVRIANFLVFVMGYLVIISGATYFSNIIERRVRVSIQTWKNIEYVIGVIGIVMILINAVSPFLYDFDNQNRYYRLSGSWLISFIYVMGVLLIMALLLNFFKKLTGMERFAVCAALILPLISLVLQVFHYGASLVSISTCVTVILTFVSHMLDYTSILAKREREREKWISDENIRLLYNQIKPHFVYNALTGIYYGLEEDIPSSRKALKNLASYLRGSLDVLDERECIEFSRELATVQCYLDVESFRFENQISVELDIQDTDFCVPAFCLQTLVENAVQHGIRKKEPPVGHIRICTRNAGEAHEVEIIDDGVGFDVSKAFEKEGVHIGLRNTKERLELMCGGTMTVESTSGVGTRITVRIPADTNA
ncbi:MAG: histidine kinase [Lachnospiraceae bacterium]|nr:histidine kinase [Lachnospiraceae bacterium]